MVVRMLLAAGLLWAATSGAGRPLRAAEPPSDDSGFVPLLNGRDFTGWTVRLDGMEKNQDPNKIIQFHDGLVHMYKDAEGGGEAPMGLLCTDAEYSHYHLRLEYRWGQKKFGWRANDKRDAGILYHISDLTGLIGPWPRSNEFQIQEGDTGDITTVCVRVSSTIDPKSEAVPPRFLPASEGGVPRRFGVADNIAFQTKLRTVEREGWNTIDLVVRGDSADYFVNGTLVDQCTQMEQPDPDHAGEWLPLTKGRILLQAELAEVFYRNVVLKPLKPAAETTSKTGATSPVSQGK